MSSLYCEGCRQVHCICYRTKGTIPSYGPSDFVVMDEHLDDVLVLLEYYSRQIAMVIQFDARLASVHEKLYTARLELRKLAHDFEAAPTNQWNVSEISPYEYQQFLYEVGKSTQRPDGEE